MIKIFDAYINDSIEKKLKENAISFNNQEEMMNICNRLLELGYTVYNHEKILKDKDGVHNFKYFIYTSYFVRTEYTQGRISKSLTCDEFFNLVGGYKKFKKIENSIIDPYSEEDWRYIEESLSNKYDLKVGDRVIYKYPKNVMQARENGLCIEFNNIHGKILNRYVYGYNVGMRKHQPLYFGNISVEFDKFINGHNCGSLGKDGYCFNVPCLFPEDEDYYSNKIKKEEELKNKMKDIDPYGEEDWGEDVDESFNIFKKGDVVVINGEVRYFNNIDELLEKNLLPRKTILKSKIGIFLTTSKQHELYLVQEANVPKNIDSKFYIVKPEHIWLLDNKEEARRGMEWAIKDKETREKTKDIDPYGEENWE